jgi:Flp pilus assembly protein TadG
VSRPRRRRRPDAGTLAIEVVLLTPALVAILMLMLGGYRVTKARSEVEAAAQDAARTYSLTLDQQQAEQAATASLQDAGLTCKSPTVDTAGSKVIPGGTAMVTVTCTVPLSDLAFIPAGDMKFSSTARAPIDPYRAG